MHRRAHAFGVLFLLGCGASRPPADTATLASSDGRARGAEAAPAPAPPPEPDPPGTMHQVEVPIAAPFPVVREVASDPARYFAEVSDLGEVRVVDKTDQDTDVYVSSELLDGAIRFFTVVRIRFVPDPAGLRLHGESIRGNIGKVVVDAWARPDGATSRFRVRMAVDPILPIPHRTLFLALGRVVRRTVVIVRRESEARARAAARAADAPIGVPPSSAPRQAD